MFKIVQTLPAGGKALVERDSLKPSEASSMFPVANIGDTVYMAERKPRQVIPSPGALAIIVADILAMKAVVKDALTNSSRTYGEDQKTAITYEHGIRETIVVRCCDDCDGSCDNDLIVNLSTKLASNTAEVQLTWRKPTSGWRRIYTITFDPHENDLVLSSVHDGHQGTGRWSKTHHLMAAMVSTTEALLTQAVGQWAFTNPDFMQIVNS